MSTLGDALKGIKQLLTLQMQVEALDRASRQQDQDLRRCAEAIAAIDKRLVRIETMVEMATSRGLQSPRIEG